MIFDNKQNKDDDILFSYSNNSQIFDGVPNNLVKLTIICKILMKFF